jgi:hypothetical protein
MKTMKDFLRWYNNCDVIPMVEAVDKMFVFYRAKSLDIFKDDISLPGLAYKMLLSCTEEKFLKVFLIPYSRKRITPRDTQTDKESSHERAVHLTVIEFVHGFVLDLL